jgi:transcriptional regulator with XRE-family HTH domain
MSPFSTYLRTLRRARGLRQVELAHLLGYEPSFISSHERSQKGPPRKDFIGRLIRGLKLDASEQAALSKAIDASRRQISLPPRASEQEFELLHEMEPQLGQLTPLQIQLIRLALKLPSSVCSSAEEWGGLAFLQPERKEAPKM